MGKKDGRCWVHARCFNAEVVQIQYCLRCGKSIEDEEESDEANCAGGKSGTIHKTCAVVKSKKRAFDEADILLVG